MPKWRKVKNEYHWKYKITNQITLIVVVDGYDDGNGGRKYFDSGINIGTENETIWLNADFETLQEAKDAAHVYFDDTFTAFEAAWRVTRFMKE